MSGKNKQRTKGNVKPSSSGRTAELLERDGGGAISFVGFGAMSGDLGYVPTMKVGGEDYDDDLDNDLRITMRKMTKKDTVTKLKAIQEFGEYCESKEESAVLGALPHFPRIYNRLVLDADKRVREATQHALQHLVARAGRNLAPHLKQLMGAWLLSQCDSYPPCALGAKMAFKRAFPSDEKRRGAVGFCFREALAYIEANLLVETVASLTDPKTLSPAEQKDRYIEVVAASALGLKTCIDLLPETSTKSSSEALIGLLRHDKLWKLGKHESPHVRSAFLAVLKSLCDKFPSSVEEFLPKMTPLTLGRLDDTDPNVASSLWQAVLALISKFPACWSHVNLNKAFLPKLWSLLKQAGGGSAYIIFPNLLPLLGHLPPEITSDGLKFYKTFFEKLKLGLNNKDQAKSSGEESAILKSYVECLHYAASTSVKENGGDKEFLQYILLEELLPLLEEAIKNMYTQSSAQTTFTQTSSFLAFLARVHSSGSVVSEVLKQFWESLATACTSVLQTDPPIPDQLRNLAALIADLNSPGRSESLYKKLVRTKSLGRHTRVTFSPKVSYKLLEDFDEERPECEPLGESDHKESDISPKQEGNIVNSLEKDLMMREFVQRLLEFSWIHSLPRSEESGSDHGSRHVSDYLAFIADVQFALRSYKEFVAIMLSINDRSLLPGHRSEHINSGSNRVDNLEMGSSTKSGESEEMRFLDILASRISTVEELGKGHNRAFEVLMEMMLQAIVQCPTSDCSALLNSALGLLHGTAGVTTFLIKVKNLPEESLKRQCFSSPKFAEALVSLTSDLCRQSMTGSGAASREQWSLVAMAFEMDADDKPYLDVTHAEQILRVIYQTLQEAHSEPHPDEAKTRTVNLICDVAASFFSSVKTCIYMPAAEDLLLALFQLTCKNDFKFSDSLKAKVEKSWRCGLEGIVKATGGFIKTGGLLEKLAKWIKAHLFQKKGNFDSIQSFARATCTVCQILHQNLPGIEVEGPSSGETTPTSCAGDINNVIGTFIQMVLCDEKELCEYASLLNDHNFLTLLVRGSMTFDPTQLYPSDMHYTTCYITHALFVSELIQSTFPEDQGKRYQFTWPSTLHLQWILDISLARAWCEVTLGCEDEAKIPEAGALSQDVPAITHQALSTTSTVLARATKNLSEDEWKLLLLQAKERTKKDGLAEFISLKHLLRDFQSTASDGFNIDVVSLCGGLDRLASLASICDLQTLESVLPYVTIPFELLQCHIAVLMTTDPLSATSLTESFFSLSAASACIPFLPSSDLAQTEQIFGNLLSYLVQLRESDNGDGLFLFECSLADASNTSVLVNVKVMQLLTNIATVSPSSLETDHWDFVMCSLVSWCHTCTESLLLERTYLHTAFYTAAFNLLTTIANLMSSEAAVSGIPPNLSTEWAEFFASGIFDALLPAYVHWVEHESGTLHTPDLVFLGSFSSAVALTPAPQVKGHMLPARLIPDSPSFVPDEMQTLLNTFSSLMKQEDRGVVISAFKILQTVMPHIAQFYEEGSRKTSDSTTLGDDEILIPPPKPILEILTQSEADLEELFGDVPVGDYIIVDQSSEGYQSCLRYLLAWQLFLRLFESTKNEVRAEFAAYLKRNESLSSLLQTLFKLMPTNPTIKTTDSPSKKQGKQEPMTLFSKTLDLEPNVLYAPSRDLPHLASSVYRHALQVMPALIRQWWSNQDRRVANVVDRYTAAYVSPLLCANELRSVGATGCGAENLSVVARVKTREVVATYALQDLSIELVVTLPTNHPLGVITVESGRKVGVSAAQWRNWMLQLTTYLTKQGRAGTWWVYLHAAQWRNWMLQLLTYLNEQNGTILDGLELWRQNVDKKFEGLEECTVCFSVIHGANCSLPKIGCRTCKKKFHSACLYKWFKSSNQSSCPLCRSPF